MIINEAFPATQRKFAADRDRILARAIVELKWNLPEFHHQILRILEDMQALEAHVTPVGLSGELTPKYGIRRIKSLA